MVIVHLSLHGNYEMAARLSLLVLLQLWVERLRLRVERLSLLVKQWRCVASYLLRLRKKGVLLCGKRLFLHLQVLVIGARAHYKIRRIQWYHLNVLAANIVLPLNRVEHEVLHKVKYGRLRKIFRVELIPDPHANHPA